MVTFMIYSTFYARLSDGWCGQVYTYYTEPQNDKIDLVSEPPGRNYIVDRLEEIMWRIFVSFVVVV